MLAWIFLFVILALVGKLIYDVQQKKNKPTQTEDVFDKDTLQKLAGIKGEKHSFSSETIEALKSSVQNMEFPEPDKSIPVTTTKLATIGGDYSDSDPLASVPMSRVSDKAKQKMAEIAKEDIKINTEAKANELINKGLVTLPTEPKPKRKYTKKPKA
jgi:hypothetical protein